MNNLDCFLNQDASNEPHQTRVLDLSNNTPTPCTFLLFECFLFYKDAFVSALKRKKPKIQDLGIIIFQRT